jgi:Na+/melibiose symporter-like transporter
MASDQIAPTAASTAASTSGGSGGSLPRASTAGGSGGSPPRASTVLGNRDFARLFAGETISQIGSQVTAFTMPLVAIITLNATAFQVGILNALKFVPVIVVALFAGVWLDRRRRRPIMMMCALGNVLLIGLVPISSVTGFLSIGLLYVVITLSGTLTVIFDVGALSYVPFLVDRENLTESNSKLQASTAFAGIAGPGLAGLIVGLITAPITLSVDAFSYLFSAAGIMSIRKREPVPQRSDERTSIRQSLAEGFRAVYGTKLLRILLGQSAVLNVGFGAVSTMFTIYGVRVLHLSPDKLGIAIGSLAAGALCGALLAARVQRALGMSAMMALAIVAVCASPLLLLIPRNASLGSMAFLMAAWLGHGFGISMWNVNTITLRQVLTPMRLLARMNATYRMLLFGALPVGAFLAGVLGSTVGLRHAMLISVIALTLPMAWLTFSPVFRLKEMPAGPQSEPSKNG